MIKRGLVACIYTALVLTVAASARAANLTHCEMSFTLKGWSVIWKSYNGEGTITCDNGQRARVKVRARGLGLTAGKSEVHEGVGKFSEVTSINELFGSYVAAAAQAGAVKSAQGTVMTKGEVSLALGGKGSGFELGLTIDKFTITRIK
ncbi:MAG: hypothetical protein C4291_13850 [Candidatus Dadabacteria bacterium]